MSENFKGLKLTKKNWPIPYPIKLFFKHKRKVRKDLPKQTKTEAIQCQQTAQQEIIKVLQAEGK